MLHEALDCSVEVQRVDIFRIMIQKFITEKYLMVFFLVFKTDANTLYLIQKIYST